MMIGSNSVPVLAEHLFDFSSCPFWVVRKAFDHQRALSFDNRLVHNRRPASAGVAGSLERVSVVLITAPSSGLHAHV